MSYLNIDSKLITLFYRSCVISILTFCVSAWGGNCSKKDSARFNRCLKHACRMCKIDCDTFDNIYLDMCCKKLSSILKDESHPLCKFIVRSPKSGRILHITSKTVRFLNSFLPFSIRNSANPRLLV